MRRFDKKLGIWNPDKEASAAQLKSIRKIEEKLGKAVFTGRTISDAYVFIHQYKKNWRKDGN